MQQPGSYGSDVSSHILHVGHEGGNWLHNQFEEMKYHHFFNLITKSLYRCSYMSYNHMFFSVLNAEQPLCSGDNQKSKRCMSACLHVCRPLQTDFSLHPDGSPGNHGAVGVTVS